MVSTQALGARTRLLDPGHALVWLQVEGNDMVQGGIADGSMHGGVMAALCDVAVCHSPAAVEFAIHHL